MLLAVGAIVRPPGRVPKARNRGLGPSYRGLGRASGGTHIQGSWAAALYRWGRGPCHTGGWAAAYTEGWPEAHTREPAKSLSFDVANPLVTSTGSQPAPLSAPVPARESDMGRPARDIYAVAAPTRNHRSLSTAEKQEAHL